jgi:hypothetical protein
MYYNISASTVNYGTSFISATANVVMSTGYAGQLVNINNLSGVSIDITPNGCNFRDYITPGLGNTIQLPNNGLVTLVFNGDVSWLILFRSAGSSFAA